MKLLLVAPLLVAGTAVCMQMASLFTPHKDTHSEIVVESSSAKKWKSLFNGKDLTGWHTYGKSTINPSWKAVHGEIFFDSKTKTAEERKNPGDLVTDEEFENFHLKLDWKVSKNGNSGVIFWSNEDTAKFKESWHTGPEMQILDNDGHSDGKIEKHRAGNLYDLIAGKEGVVKPFGEWNTSEIIADHGKLTFKLNGEEVVSTRYDDENWKTMIAGSKFKTKKYFGTFTKGHIVLQDHGNDVWFKNIQIMAL
jgi:hypothetical protein